MKQNFQKYFKYFGENPGTNEISLYTANLTLWHHSYLITRL